MIDIIIANEAHVSAIARLERLCFKQPWSEKMVSDEIKNPSARYFLAVSDDRVLGYAGIQTVLDEGYITNIATDPIRRRQGIGKALMIDILRYAAEKKLSFVTLEVRESNEAAIALYTKASFKEVGRRKGYYQNPEETAILFTLNF